LKSRSSTTTGLHVILRIWSVSQARLKRDVGIDALELEP
jgi:hypothetical protein